MFAEKIAKLFVGGRKTMEKASAAVTCEYGIQGLQAQ